MALSKADMNRIKSFLEPENNPNRPSKAVRDRFDEAVTTTFKACQAAQADWLDRWMQRLLPEEIYLSAKSRTTEVLKQVSEYLKLHNIHLMIFDDGHSAIAQGERILGELRIKVSNGSVEVSAKDLTEGNPLDNSN